MRKRLMIGLATVALLAAMLPGLASAQPTAVTICHKGIVTLQLPSLIAVNAHLRHGDTLGACS